MKKIYVITLADCNVDENPKPQKCYITNSLLKYHRYFNKLEKTSGYSIVSGWVFRNKKEIKDFLINWKFKEQDRENIIIL